MKGFWHIVDAVLATVILLSFLIIASRAVLVTPEETRLNRIPFTVLNGLDNKGVLRDRVVAMDAAALEGEITQFLYNYGIQICDAENNCNGTVPSAKNVWVGAYFISGNHTYDPHTVKLYIWREQ